MAAATTASAFGAAAPATGEFLVKVRLGSGERATAQAWLAGKEAAAVTLIQVAWGATPVSAQACMAATGVVRDRTLRYTGEPIPPMWRGSGYLDSAVLAGACRVIAIAGPASMVTAAAVTSSG